jgi:virulence factor
MNSNGKKLRVGVVGVGTMGRHHVRLVGQSPGVTLVGFHDPDPARAEEICSLYGCACLGTLDELMDSADALTVAAPTSLHLEIGERCLDRGLHLLMEKPLAHDLKSSARLVELARKAEVVLMVGHVERYNPAVAGLIEMLQSIPEQIISIDARRLAPFDGSRCMDVDVLHDLLIHDIDLALEIAGAPLKNVTATGRPVFSHQVDVAHVRVEFQNDSTAVFWTGKCSPRKVRALTVTTPTRQFVADTLAHTLTMYSAEQLPAMTDGVCFMGNLREETISVPNEEPLRREFDDFFRSILQGTKPLVDGDRALRAMKALALVSRSISAGGEMIEAE